jgi:hypothetical protein
MGSIVALEAYIKPYPQSALDGELGGVINARQI